MFVPRSWLLAVGIAAAALAAGIAMSPHSALAQSPSGLGNENLLQLVLPPVAGGGRPGVHLWARADQAQGPGGYPTVFVVTLFTEQGSSGPEEHEVVNYVQYSNGGWAPARPAGDGTLLLADWSWISLNLTNLSASVAGSGNSSTYTVDYTASGPYGSSTRQIAVEEAYGADLSLLSSTVLSDTNPSSNTGSSSPPAVPSASPSPAPAGSTSPAPVGSAAPVVPAILPTPPPTPRSGTTPAPTGGNLIVVPSPTRTPAR